MFKPGEIVVLKNSGDNISAYQLEAANNFRRDYGCRFEFVGEANCGCCYTVRKAKGFRKLNIRKDLLKRAPKVG